MIANPLSFGGWPRSRADAAPIRSIDAPQRPARARRPAVLIASLLALVGALSPLAFAREGPAGRPLTLHTPQRPICKPGYAPKRETFHVRRRHRRITLHKTVCVRSAGNTGGGSTSGGSGGSAGGSGGLGGSSGPPVATADAYAVPVNTTLAPPAPGVLANDHGSAISAYLIAAAAHGTMTLGRNGSFSYTPTHGFIGSDKFTYKAVDSSYNSSSFATVTITVTPYAAPASFAASSGTQLVVRAPGVLAGAVGSGLTASISSTVAHGVLALSPDGSFTYTPTAGYTGNDGFTYQATDSAGGASNIARVTFDVTSAPAPQVVAETFAGAVGNTELQVGGARGAEPEVYLAGASALAGDSDPAGGTLSTAPGAITTSQGGVVEMATDGTFTYTPPLGYAGSSDSFNYDVKSSEGLDVPASATIGFSGRTVWYVDDTARAGGDGTASAPFDTLAAASTAAGAGDVIYLVGTATPYAGGIALRSDQWLIGSAASLQIAGNTLAPANGTAPTITDGAGAGVTLAEGDLLDGVVVSGTAGDGIDASGVASATIGSGVSVSHAGGDGVRISGGSGTIDVGAAISGSDGGSVAVSGRTGGTVVISGAIVDTGTGVRLTNNGGARIDITGTLHANTGPQPAFTATGGGTITLSGSSSTLATTTATALDVENTTIGSAGLTFQSISSGTQTSGPSEAIVLAHTGTTGALFVDGTGAAGSGGLIENTTGASAVSLSATGEVHLDSLDIQGSAGNGVGASNVAWLDVTSSQITNSAGEGIVESGDGSVGEDFQLEGDTLTGQSGTAIDVSTAGSVQGTIAGDAIGTPAAGSGSLSGDGIDIAASAGTATVTLSANTIDSIASGRGVYAEGLGTGDLNLDVLGNTVSMNGGGSGDALDYVATDSASLCLNTGGNTAVAAGSAADGTSLHDNSSSSVFELQRYVGGAFDDLAVAAFLTGRDTLSGGGGGQAASATLAGANTTGFTNAICLGGVSSS